MAADRSETYTANEVVKYHHVISSISPDGSGWNADTNKFRCPYDGYYRFVATVYKTDDKSDNNNYLADLMISGTGIVRVYNIDRDGGIVYYSSTMSAIVPCEAGQEVWVRIEPGSGTSTHLHSDEDRRNQFSGQLIKQGLD